ncbi:DUF3617 domain-containing protein [Sphingomonas sp.]|jgi:hypothetical protein|uniref:DUF3617 domain-containing protein n=1 Tax=Sphingomonas sp. TaxID=28214 RepID=UPI002ED8B00B
MIALALTMMPALALAQSAGVTPGLWEIAVTLGTIDMPGAPAFVANMMRGKTTRIKHCVTPQEAARGPQDMLKSNKSCTFGRYTMQSGRMGSAMTCANGGQVTKMVSTGSFTPTSFTSPGQSVVTGTMPMTMTSTANDKLPGACKK